MSDETAPLAVTTEIGSPSQLAELYGALAAAQGEFLPITKNRVVMIDLKSFRYADLEEITAKTRPALSKHGLATTQPISMSTSGTGTSIFTRLMHKGGATIESEIPLTQFMRGEIKEYGAAVTYMRRYAKGALLDIAADDDLDESGKGSGAKSEPAAEGDQPEGVSNTYSPELFEKNLPTWTKGVEDKKTTPQNILKMLATKAPLTDAQRDIILNLKPETAK